MTVAKAGLVASLPARTTIVAAANPVGGRYNKSLTLSQNLRMSPAMISRFDLVFLCLTNLTKKLIDVWLATLLPENINASLSGR